MISVTGITGKYILQPELLAKHTKTLELLSACLLWKSEVIVFQKILDERGAFLRSIPDKKQADHFQSLITYYRGEVIDALRKKLRDHETRLARMLESENENDTQYYKEHDAIMDEANTFSKAFTEFRNDFLHFMETKNELHS